MWRLAAKSLAPGDIIESVGTRQIDDVDELRRAVGDTKPGVQLRLVVWRDRASRKIDVAVGELAKPDAKAPPETSRTTTK